MLNEVLVGATGERHLLRDQGALESGLNRARNRWLYVKHTSLANLAAELTFGIGKAHAFEQGNKRTAWAAARQFLYGNGLDMLFTTEQQYETANLVERVITDQVPLDVLESLFDVATFEHHWPDDAD